MHAIDMYIILIIKSIKLIVAHFTLSSANIHKGTKFALFWRIVCACWWFTIEMVIYGWELNLKTHIFLLCMVYILLLRKNCNLKQLFQPWTDLFVGKINVNFPLLEIDLFLEWLKLKLNFQWFFRIDVHSINCEHWK